jgi:2-oxo-4-hydroxy-4-carboxy-5-ureidoimidazoline decarboxylase
MYVGLRSAAMIVPGHEGLRRLNELPPTAFEQELLQCCAVPEWAAAVRARRPFSDLAELRAVAGEEFGGLGWTAVRRALDAHPRIGDRAAGAGREAAWSRAEQSAAATGDQRVKDELVEANVAYEERFGHVFLICATGLAHREILAAARERLRNDFDTERAVVRAELGKIVDLRIGKLVDR